MNVKVLQLVSNPLVGGTETFVLGLVPRLRAAGLDVRLVNLWDGGGEIARLCRARDIPCDVLDAGRRRFRPAALPMLRALLRRERFDVVTAYGLRTTLLLRAAAAIGVPGANGTGGGMESRPALLTGLRGMDDWRRPHHVWADRLTDGWIDYFVGVSRSVCRRRVERERTPPRKVLYIPNGIDTGHFRRDAAAWPDRAALGLPPGRISLTVANLREPKGHGFQLDVIARLARLPTDVTFVWVGTGPDEAALRARAATLGLTDRVTVYGAADDVRPLLAHAELFFLSSKEEGMPRALMEAMAMGVPALTTDVGGCKEVVRDTIDGLTVPYGDVDAAAHGLQSLFDDAALRGRLGAAGAERIRDTFAFDAVAARYAELYRLLAAGKRDEVERAYAFEGAT